MRLRLLRAPSQESDDALGSFADGAASQGPYPRRRRGPRRTVGPSQVAARAVEMGIARCHHPIWTKVASTSLVAAGLAALWIGVPIIPLALALASVSKASPQARCRSPFSAPNVIPSLWCALPCPVSLLRRPPRR